MDLNKMIGFLLILCLTHLSWAAEGNCDIGGVTEDQWDNELVINIVDTDSGIVMKRTTSNISSVLETKEVLYILNNPPYLNATVVNGSLTVSLSDRFKDYETNETLSKMAYQLRFQCSVGIRKLIIVFNIRDTNNHPPVFLPTNLYNYSIVLPIPRGFPISYVSDIIVRDDDITNFEIVPQIQANDYFELSYVDTGCVGKRYKLALVAKTNIQEFNSTVLIIGATDKDQTGYPPLTTFGQVTITKGLDLGPGKDFEFEDPLYPGVFDNTKIVVDFDKNISMRGFNDNMTFTLAGNGSEYFQTVKNPNNIIIVPSSVIIPESIILSPETMNISLFTTLGEQSAETKLSIQFLKDPSCELTQFPPTIWETGLVININDTATGDSLRALAKYIVSILSYSYEVGELNDSAYIIPAKYGNRIDWEINATRFKNYEIFETAEEFSMYVTFRCSRNIRVLKVTHAIKDSNNHSPYLSSHTGDPIYRILTPMPANYSITRTYGDLIVTDSDLTNYAIDADLEYNSYIALQYRGLGSTKKQHIFDLITKIPIDSIASPIELNMTFREVDLTGGIPNFKTILIKMLSLERF